jgi:hypothetical protein
MGPRRKVSSSTIRSSESDEFSFLQLCKSIEELAQILCNIELKFYQAIRPEEFLEKLIWSGTDGEKNPKTKNLFTMIEWVNQVNSFFYCSSNLFFNESLIMNNE